MLKNLHPITSQIIDRLQHLEFAEPLDEVPFPHCAHQGDYRLLSFSFGQVALALLGGHRRQIWALRSACGHAFPSFIATPPLPPSTPSSRRPPPSADVLVKE